MCKYNKNKKIKDYILNYQARMNNLYNKINFK